MKKTCDYLFSQIEVHSEVCTRVCAPKLRVCARRALTHSRYLDKNEEINKISHIGILFVNLFGLQLQRIPIIPLKRMNVSNSLSTKQTRRKFQTFFLFIFLFVCSSVRSFALLLLLVHINIINNIRAERYQFHINIHKS